MHFNWHKSFSRVLASSVVAVCATTSLNAIPKGPCDSKVPDVCCEEPKPGPFAFAYPMDMNLSCPRDFYVRVEGLAFQAKEDGLEFGVADSSGVGVAPLSHGRVIGFSDDSHDYDYNPGVRFGMGFYLDHDAWNLDFTWTWLNITNYQFGNAGSATEDVIPLWLLGLDTPANQCGGRSSAVWKAHYNTFDIRLGKPYHVSRYLVYNPHFGVRVGWIDQHFSVNYGGVQGPVAGNTTTIAHGDNDFWGVGARAGIDTDWILGKGWCLFGNVAGSMLFGSFDVDQNMTLADNTDGTDIKYDFYQNVPNFEIALGVGWGMHFDKDRYHVGVRAAYEFHEWLDQFNMRKFWNGVATGTADYNNDVVSRGNLTLNGFSLRVQFDI